MDNKHSGNILVSVALALFAGVMGSVLTLMATNNLSLSTVNSPSAPTSEVSATSRPGASDLATPAPDSANRPVSQITANTASSLKDMNDALEQASAERAQLAQVLAQLTAQIETLEADLINSQALAALDVASPETDQTEHHTGLADRDGSGQSSRPQDRIESLVASGVDADQAQALQARQDRYQLARLELFDLAEREGWADSEQLSERLEELEQQRPDLRAELGDEAYDRYLYEAGRSNRVVIESIIPGSSADIAGLQIGDMVIRYANLRVFTTGDLQRATRSGVRDEPVAVDVERQGQIQFFEVPRGPLGVTLRAQQRSPS